MKVYYNENDKFCVQWLKNLMAAGMIPDGDIDDRSIEDVKARDLAGYEQCHFFTGIAGWPLALRLAAWGDRPVWTGSCPCQPFSNAGKRFGIQDKRHLWPAWHTLITQLHPPVLFGEQVMPTASNLWWDTVSNDLESQNYATAAAVLPACSVGAPHRRYRLFFVANSYRLGREAYEAVEVRKREHALDRSDSELYARHWSIEPQVGRLANGISSRMAKLRALGNAIVPQVAAEFIKAFQKTGEIL